jgi:hypothetical protein
VFAGAGDNNVWSEADSSADGNEALRGGLCNGKLYGDHENLASMAVANDAIYDADVGIAS